MYICKHCGKEFVGWRTHNPNKFCCKTCSAQYRVAVYVKDWIDGKNSGCYGRNYRISACVRHFLIGEAARKCTLCGWGEINPKTGLVPLQIDHIDGNAANCLRSNLRVLCPNCHSLTPNYGVLNAGNSVRVYPSSKKYLSGV